MYDNNGNRTNLTFDAFGETNTYLPNSNQLTNQGSSSITRDVAGNRTSDNNGTRTFTYNQTGRLFEVYESSSLIATYTYNAFGQRTRKVTDTSTTVYHYDLKGQLIYESSDNGQAQTTYLYTDTAPVAQIDQTNTGDVITYLHTDHLNTPRRGTDVNGITVWAWQGTAFGSFTANEDPDNDGAYTTINLRFPGQYYDQETKLHYNYFRYYDPSTGRYITSDPIGLRGGLNTFGYVGGNPGRWVDPSGEAAIGLGVCIGILAIDAYMTIDTLMSLSEEYDSIMTEIEQINSTCSDSKTKINVRKLKRLRELNIRLIKISNQQLLSTGLGIFVAGIGAAACPALIASPF